MAKAKKTEEQGFFRVTTDQECIIENATIDEAFEKIGKLQKQNIAPLYFHNDKTRETLMYSKESYQQNYRVIKHQYSNGVAIPEE